MNFTSRVSAMAPYINGRSLDEIFQAHEMRWPAYGAHPKFHCLECGAPMSPSQIQPPGRATPRAMCQSCYDAWGEWIWTHKQCGVCGDSLGKLFNQFQAYPHDLHYRLCSGKCMDYFSLCSAYAIGYPTGLRDVPAHMQRTARRVQPAYPQLPQGVGQQDVIDMVPRGQRALPEPDESLRVPNFDRHRGRPVEYVPARKR